MDLIRMTLLEGRKRETNPHGLTIGLVGITLEFFHGRGTAAFDSFSPQDLPDGEEKYFKIQVEGDIVDIIDVVLKTLFPGQCVAAVDLGPAGDAGFYLMAPALEIIIQGQVLFQPGTGADQ